MLSFVVQIEATGTADCQRLSKQRERCGPQWALFDPESHTHGQAKSLYWRGEGCWKWLLSSDTYKVTGKTSHSVVAVDQRRSHNSMDARDRPQTMRAAPGAGAPRVFCKTLQGLATKALATIKGRLVCSSALLHSFMKGENVKTRTCVGNKKF